VGGRENLSREQLVEIIERLERRIAALEAENADLKRRLAAASKDSSTSSKPPSSDIVKPPRPPGHAGHGRIGGQPGHPRHERPPFAPDQIDTICLHELPPQEVRRRKLRPLDSWHVLQQVERVEKPYVVTEHRARRYVTPAGRIVLAPLPPEIRGAGLLGPNLTALVGWLKACGHVSYRRIEEFFGDVLALPIFRRHVHRVGRCEHALLLSEHPQRPSLRDRRVVWRLVQTARSVNARPLLLTYPREA
jgi:transposase